MPDDPASGPSHDPVTADELARAWPEARYVIVPDAGHSALEPCICRELVSACDRFAQSGVFS